MKTTPSTLIFRALGVVLFYLTVSSHALAASTGGCDNYTPDASGTVVTCTSSTTPAATAGVTSTTATTPTSFGNNVTVNIGAGTVLNISGSTVGLGSGAIVTNNGTLNTNSFTYGYGISVGANGRSQNGGAAINNTASGSIITAGGNANGIYISATNAGSTGNSITNAGSVTTSGSSADGISINTMGGASVTQTINNSGTITVSGAGSNGINVSGSSNDQTSITNTGSITASSGAGINANAGTKLSLISNSGTISGSTFGVNVSSGTATVTTLTNTGTITGGISNAGTITTLNTSQNGLSFTSKLPTNYNVIVNSTSSYGKTSFTTPTGSMAFGIYSTSTLTANTYASVLSGLTSSNISTTSGVYGGYNWLLNNSSGNIWDLVVSGSGNGGGSDNGNGNSGNGSSTVTQGCLMSASISNACHNLVIPGGTNKVVIPNGTVISTSDNTAAITNTGATGSIINNGQINGGINNANSGATGAAVSTIESITNNGQISGVISNTSGGTIGTISNAQGGTSGPLNYSGALPANYVVIVNGTSFGQFSASAISGVMGFGVSADSVLNHGSYASVLIGINPSNLANTTGVAAGYFYKLTQEKVSTTWDMYVGASVADTNSSLVQTTNALQGQFGSQSNAVITGMTYDCNLFGPNNVCISAGGRATNNSAQGYNTASALLIAAYRASNQMRFGAYLDQNLSASNPNGIISAGNGQPMGGLFAVWNDKLDGTGTEIKASVGYNNKNMTITRPVVGTSEAGSGSTGLTSQGVNAIAKYGFGVSNQVVVSPYVGVRYMNTNMGSYSESASSSVLFPLSYASMSMNATTALAGLGANYKATEDWTFAGNAGVESDLSTSNGSYTVTNVSGLTPVGLNPNPVKTRPTAMLAAYYNLGKNTQLGLTGLYRTDSFSGMSSTTGMATVTFGM
jgi:hypothetical protein